MSDRATDAILTNMRSTAIQSLAVNTAISWHLTAIKTLSGGQQTVGHGCKLI